MKKIFDFYCEDCRKEVDGYIPGDKCFKCNGKIMMSSPNINFSVLGIVLLIIFTVGDPDLIDVIIQYIQKLIEKMG